MLAISDTKLSFSIRKIIVYSVPDVDRGRYVVSSHSSDVRSSCSNARDSAIYSRRSGLYIRFSRPICLMRVYPKFSWHLILNLVGLMASPRSTLEVPRSFGFLRRHRVQNWLKVKHWCHHLSILLRSKGSWLIINLILSLHKPLQSILLEKCVVILNRKEFEYIIHGYIRPGTFQLWKTYLTHSSSGVLRSSLKQTVAVWCWPQCPLEIWHTLCRWYWASLSITWLIWTTPICGLHLEVLLLWTRLIIYK